MTPEKSVQNKIVNYIKSLQDSGVKIEYFRRQAVGGSYHSGLPDLYAVYNGHHIEIEVKSAVGDVRNLQLKWEERLKAAGSYYILARSLADFITFFESIE